MGPAARKRAVIDLLAQSGHTSIAELAERFGVSTMTIRRDLAVLAEEGLLVIDQGEVLARSGSVFELSMDAKGSLEADRKRRIGLAAARRLTGCGSVFIDAGTTAQEAARFLARRNGCTFLTHSLLAAHELAAARDSRIIMCPGELRTKSKAFIGQMTCDFIRDFRMDAAVIGVEGISADGGLSVPDPTDGLVKRCALEQASYTICVADSSKFEQRFLYRIAPVDAVDLYVTDSDLDPDLLQTCREAGMEIITV